MLEIISAAEAPCDPAGFVAWFEELDRTGPGQGDPLFPYLAEQASISQMRADQLIAICLSGRGDKDIFSVAEYLGEKL